MPAPAKVSSIYGTLPMSFQRRPVVVPFPLASAMQASDTSIAPSLAQLLASLDAASAAGNQASAELQIDNIYALLDQGAQHETAVRHCA